jgi:hypothetical protein
MSARIPNTLLMAWHAGFVCLFGNPEPILTPRHVTVNAVQLAGSSARIHEPSGVGVILPPGSPIGIKVQVFKSNEIVMVEETFSWLETVCQRPNSSVAGGTAFASLLGGQRFPADDFHILQRFPPGRITKDPGMFISGSMASITADSGFGPFVDVGFRFGIVIGGKLHDVAMEAGCIEREHRVPPIPRVIAAIDEVPHDIVQHIEPGLFQDVICERHDLKAAPLKGRQEVEHIASTHDVLHPVPDVSLLSPFDHPSMILLQLDAIGMLPDRNFPFREQQAVPGKLT